MAVEWQFGWCLVGSYSVLPPVGTETDTDTHTHACAHAHAHAHAHAQGYLYYLCIPQHHPVVCFVCKRKVNNKIINCYSVTSVFYKSKCVLIFSLKHKI